MEKPELLLPAGNVECLRAAVANGADAVYLGLQYFNARRKAGNFSEKNLSGVVRYCHDHNVKVYVTLNIMLKNEELQKAMNIINGIFYSNADAIIIQDICLIPSIKKYFPNLSIHLSTQATVTNSYMIPEGVDRIILAREMKYEQVKKISRKYETEIFVHGALCISYSGQCLFSSIVGGRSGNRGLCAQPCRKKYNNSYLLSTKELCLLEKLPEIAKSGVRSLKIEGRLRSSLYVGTVARIYRKYIDRIDNWKKVDESDIETLKIVFSREFTKGFMFEDSIIDKRMPMNRGLYLGKIKDGRIKLRHPIYIGDGIAFRLDDENKGKILEQIKIVGKKESSDNARKGDLVNFEEDEGTLVYKTSQSGLKVEFGKEINLKEEKITEKKFKFNFKKKYFSRKKIIARVYNQKQAVEADKAGTNIIYYDLMKKDFETVKSKLKNAELYADTPDILFDEDLPLLQKKIKKINPVGISIGNKGLLCLLKKEGYPIHLKQSFNIYNDLDIEYYSKFPRTIPTISPELSFDDINQIRNKQFIMQIHGNLRVMILKEKLKAPELIDESDRHFEIVSKGDCTEIYNFKELGLFNKILDLNKIGISYFLIDTKKDVGKYIRIYKKILSGEKFDDSKIRKGFTTGNFNTVLL